MWHVPIPSCARVGGRGDRNSAYGVITSALECTRVYTHTNTHTHIHALTYRSVDVSASEDGAGEGGTVTNLGSPH